MSGRAFALALLAASLILLAGCQLYWTKPGGYLAHFAADHRTCATAAGRPIPGDDRVLVELELYRACLKGKGWKRVTGPQESVPAGYLRGLEEPGPVRPDEVPLQPTVALPAFNERRGAVTDFAPKPTR
jgi:hypothetical protein